MISRRDFIRQSTLFMAGTLSGALLPGRGSSASESLTILFTNDTHARIEPFPQTARNFAGLGGISRGQPWLKKSVTIPTTHSFWMPEMYFTVPPGLMYSGDLSISG